MFEEKKLTRRFHPTNIGELLIPDVYSTAFSAMVAAGTIPDMIFHSPHPGSGKTSTAVLIAELMGAEVHFVDCTNDRGVDVIQSAVDSFCMFPPRGDKKIKIVIFDEADRLSAMAQDALKGFMQTYEGYCRFIFTTNHPDRIIEHIWSRCQIHVDYTFQDPNIRSEMLQKAQARTLYICQQVGVICSPEDAMALVTKAFPDIRSIYSAIESSKMTGIPIVESFNAVGDKAISDYMTAIFSCNAIAAMVSADRYGDHKLIFGGLYRAIGDTCLQYPQYAGFIPVISEFAWRASQGHIIPRLNVQHMTMSLIQIVGGLSNAHQ